MPCGFGKGMAISSGVGQKTGLVSHLLGGMTMYFIELKLTRGSEIKSPADL